MSAPQPTKTENMLPPIVWASCAIVGLICGLAGMAQGLWTHDLVAVGMGLIAVSCAFYGLTTAGIRSGFINQNWK